MLLVLASCRIKGFGKKATSPGTVGKAAFGGFAAKAATVEVVPATATDAGVSDTTPAAAAAAPKKNLFASAVRPCYIDDDG